MVYIGFLEGLLLSIYYNINVYKTFDFVLYLLIIISQNMDYVIKKWFIF